MHSRHDKRKSGITLIGDLPWGSHFCQFYQTPTDLFETLVPYLRTGLENNEYCVWVISEILDPDEAKNALKEGVPHFEKYVAGQLEIIPYSQWRAGETKSGGAIVSKLDEAITKGFDGLRLACNAMPGDCFGETFTSHCADSISRNTVIALFMYPRDRFDTLGLMDAVKNHRFALIRNAGEWEVIESSEARITKDALERSEEKLESLFRNMSEGFAYHRIVLDSSGQPCDYIFLEVNTAFERLTGLQGKEITGKRVTEAIPGIEKDPADWIAKYGKVALTGRPVKFESYSETLKRWYLVSAFSPHKGYFAVTFSDITERKQAERESGATVAFLRLVNESRGTAELVRSATTFFQEYSGCEAVGIRLREGDDYPYYETRGFSKKFIRMENSVCRRGSGGEILKDNAGNPVLSCMCGSVITGHFDHSKSFFTARGSFWTGSTTELLASITEADRQVGIRNSCNGEGYESVALIPLDFGEERIGLIQLNDRRKGLHSPEDITLWERLAGHLSVALSKFRIEEELQVYREHLEKLVEERTATLLMLNEELEQEIVERRQTEQELQESGKRLKEAEQIAHLGHWELDLVSNTLFWSDEVYRIFDLEPQEFDASYETFLDMIHPEDRELVNEAYKDSLANRTPYDLVHRLQMKDGSIKFVNEKCKTDYGEAGNPLRSLGTVMDITERKLAEEELKKHREHLEELVKERTTELIQANKELQDFAFIASHDLQEPLRKVIAFGDRLRDRYAGALDEKGRDYLKRMENAAERMRDLIEDLLQLSRITTKAMPFLPTDLEEIVHDVLSDLEELIAQADGKVRIGSLPSLDADKLQMRQLLQNLIANALKFHEEGVAPLVSIESRCLEDGFCELTVKDNGIGFDEKYLDRIFRPFQRLHGRGVFKGSGMGLAICKKIVDRHSGEITVRSAPGQGAAFFVKLPVKQRG